MDRLICFDPSGLALKYGLDGDSDGSTTSQQQTDLSESPNHRSRDEDLAASTVAGNPSDDTTARVTGGTAFALQELQNRNATLLEALEEKSRQVEELGTLVESLEPVPGLNPDAFYAVLREKSGPGKDPDLDYRDQKIVHLAKRTRALNSRLEGEKARCMKARREADVLAKELESCRRQLELVSSAGARLAAEKIQKVAKDLPLTRGSRVKGKEERLQQQVVQLRNKLQETQDEVKKYARVLSKEVGGASLELNKSLDDESGWKGRAQHIVLLKTRIRQLETQLRNSEQNPGRVATSFKSERGTNDVDNQAQEGIHFIELQRSRAIEHLEDKCHVLREDAEAFRRQMLAKGARAATLERDRAEIIDRVRMLQKKSDADDRLVDALRNELQALRKLRSTSGKM